MTKKSDSELHRIRDTYDGYKHSQEKQRNWSDQSPANAAKVKERDRQVRRVLTQSGVGELSTKRILDVGCGFGNNLANLIPVGAVPEMMAGVDLLDDRIEVAKERHPDIRFQVANAEYLPFENGSYDIVMLFTVFTSILDSEMKQKIASEVNRVLAKNGALLWYDFRFDNPKNKNVRGIGLKELFALFPDYIGSVQTLTVIPPLARVFGSAISVVYPLLAAFPFLRSHYLALLRKP